MLLKKNIVGLLSLALVLVVAFNFIGSGYQSKEQRLRTVLLQDASIDYQSILEEFDNVELTIEGSMADFVGYQDIDPALFEEIDNLSLDDKEQLQENNTVRYHFTYDSETNIITIAAELTMPDGEILLDQIQGVGFYNEKGEIDAVMNVEGEGILLSEMRDAGLIQNAGWLSKVVKVVAVAVAVTAVVVAVAAVVVVTAGAAAPALAAVGVAAASTTAATATVVAIGTYAALTAVIAAGIAITAEIVDKYYPGADATTTVVDGIQVVTAQWAKTATKDAIRDIIKAEISKHSPALYFRVTKYNNSDGPVQVEIIPYTHSLMATNMRLFSWSSITHISTNAYSVIATAFSIDVATNGYAIIPESHGLAHYHAQKPDKSHATGLNGTHIVHSFYSNLIA